MKAFRSSPILLALAITLPLLAFGWYTAKRRPSVEFSERDMTIARNRTIEIGGITRPESDVSYRRAWRRAGVRVGPDPATAPRENLNMTLGVVVCAKTPRLQLGVNPQMDSVIEAIETGNYPERLSAMHAAHRFDVAAWKADPEGYLNDHYLRVAEPGRIYDVKQPGKGVPVLSSEGSAYAELREGEAVRLAAKTAPGAPVTFTNFANGVFQNGLATITVVADKKGVAEATYTGLTGPAQADIVAGSPMASGTVRYRIEVLPAVVSATLAGRSVSAGRSASL